MHNQKAVSESKPEKNLGLDGIPTSATRYNWAVKPIGGS